MIFSVWDFSDRVEVRLSDEMIAKLKTFKKPVSTQIIHYRSYDKTKLTTITRHYWIFPEESPIGGRIFARNDHHRGKIKPHLPFVTLPQLREIQQKTQLPKYELEKAVTHVRVGLSTIMYKMSFPLSTDKDWAFLFGIWFSSGSYVTRIRGNAIEYSLRFAIDYRVFRELLKPLIASKFGYEQPLSTIYYTKKKSGHKLDAHLWTEFGSEPRPYFALLRPIREIMEKFGLPDHQEIMRRKGTNTGKSAARQFDRTLPDWILENRENMHAFTEGLLNGQSACSQFHSEGNNVARFVEPRFHGKEESVVENFYGTVASFLETEDILGYKHYLPMKHEDDSTIEIGYLIVGDSLRNLWEKYRLMRSDMRARMFLHYNMTPALLWLCKTLTSFEALMLGAIMEKPHSVEQLVTDFRCQKETVLQALQKLKELRAAKDVGAIWLYSGDFKQVISENLLAKEEQRRQMLAENAEKFFNLCDDCDIVTEKSRCPKCHKKTTPIDRLAVAEKMKLTRRQFRAKALQVAQSPTFSG